MTEEKEVVDVLKTAQEQTAITATFEQHAQECPETGREYWSARTLMSLFGYTKWERFLGAIERAMETCEGTGDVVSELFPSAGKHIPGNKGAVHNVKDFHLCRHACYLIAMHSDPRKLVIKLALRFFAVQAWEMQKVNAVRTDGDRTAVRKLMKVSEVELADAVISLGGRSSDQSKLRSLGDEAFFLQDTASLKRRWRVHKETALSDVLPVELLNGKLKVNNLTARAVDAGLCANLMEMNGLQIANATKVRKELIARNLTPELMEPMLLIGSVTGTMKTNAPVAESRIHAYRSFITDDNVSGYSEINRVDGHYVGTISNGVFTDPFVSKHHAMLAVVAAVSDSGYYSSGVILKPHRSYMVSAIPLVSELLPDPELEYLITGYLTRILNNLDLIYIGDQLESKGVDVQELRYKFSAITPGLEPGGYYVVEECLVMGMIINSYM